MASYCSSDSRLHPLCLACNGRTACSLDDEPVRTYAPLLMCPWVMQGCHSTASCHLGTARTLRMLERFSWRIDMSVCTRWWLCNCLKCQARKTSRQTVRWPIFTMLSPEGPDIAVSVDFFGPLPVAPRGNTYIMLFTDRSAAEPTCSQSQRQSSPLRARLRFSSIDMFPSGGARAAYSRTTASSFAQSFRTPAPTTQTSTMGRDVFTTRRSRCWRWLSTSSKTTGMHSCNNSVSSPTGLALNEVHTGRLRRLPLTILERAGVAGH